MHGGFYRGLFRCSKKKGQWKREPKIDKSMHPEPSSNSEKSPLCEDPFLQKKTRATCRLVDKGERIFNRCFWGCSLLPV